MKKVVSILLALVMAFSAAGIAEADVTGEWFLNTVVTEGASLNPSILGMSITMVLNADGSAIMESSFGEEIETVEGTWTTDGNTVTVLSDDGEEQAFVIGEDELTADIDDGDSMVFGRTLAEVDTYIPAAVLEDAQIADFDGTWNLFLADVMGMQLPIELLEGFIDMSMQTLIIEGGVVTMSGEDVMGDAVTSAAPGEMIDGALTLTLTDEYDNVTVIAFALHEDGVLSYADGDEEWSTMLYYEKAAEE